MEKSTFPSLISRIYVLLFVLLDFISAFWDCIFIIYTRFENHKKPTLTVNKIDSITGEPIQGAKFQVWYGSNNTTTGELNDLGTYFSDGKGQFKLELLRDGWYKVTELEPAAGYNIKEPVTQEVCIKGGENKELTFENFYIAFLLTTPSRWCRQ